MVKNLYSRYQNLLEVPFLYKFIVIFCGHLTLSYIFWNPICSPNFPNLVSFILNFPVFLLFSVLFILPFSNVFPEFLFPLLPLMFSSCLYGLGGSFLLSSKGKITQLLGLAFLILLVFTGFILVGLDQVFLCD
jgi:hypothetical protein